MSSDHWINSVSSWFPECSYIDNINRRRTLCGSWRVRLIVIVYVRNGLLSVFSITTTKMETSFTFSVNSSPTAFAVTPSACEYDSMTFSSSMDCLVLFNRFYTTSQNTMEPHRTDRKGFLLVYTSQLELRAIIPQEYILDVVITIYGILVLCPHKVIKYDFCGNLVKVVETKNDM